MPNETSAPLGQTPQPYMDETRAPVLIGIISGAIAFALVFVVLRIYVRAVAIKKWGLDDSFIVVSFCLALLTGVPFMVCTKFGLGMHAWAISPDSRQSSLRLIIAGSLSYQISFIMIKMSFLLQFRRVFVTRKFILFCDVMFGFISIFGIAVAVSSVVINAPSWRGDALSNAGYNQATWWLATACVHLVTDIIIFLMPIPMLRRLNLKRMQKAALIISFGLGFVTTCISIVRISTIPHVVTRDVTWTIVPALIWSQIELCCAIICACIPTLRPLLRVSKRNRTQRVYNLQTSEASGETRLTRKPLNGGTFGSHSQQSLPSPMFLDTEPSMEPSTEPKTPSDEPYDENRLTILTDDSPALTAGESDDGFEELEPVGEEVATPLSPPPQCYASPPRLFSRSRSASESTIGD